MEKQTGESLNDVKSRLCPRDPYVLIEKIATSNTPKVGSIKTMTTSIANQIAELKDTCSRMTTEEFESPVLTDLEETISNLKNRFQDSSQDRSADTYLKQGLSKWNSSPECNYGQWGSPINHSPNSMSNGPRSTYYWSDYSDPDKPGCSGLQSNKIQKLKSSDNKSSSRLNRRETDDDQSRSRSPRRVPRTSLNYQEKSSRLSSSQNNHRTSLWRTKSNSRTSRRSRSVERPRTRSLAKICHQEAKTLPLQKLDTKDVPFTTTVIGPNYN